MIYLFFILFLIVESISDAIRFYDFPNPILIKWFPFWRFDVFHTIKLIWIPALFLAGHYWDQIGWQIFGLIIIRVTVFAGLMVMWSKR